MAASKLSTNVEDSGFGNDKLHELFISGLNVIMEAGEEELILPRIQDAEGDSTLITRHGM